LPQTKNKRIFAELREANVRIKSKTLIPLCSGALGVFWFFYGINHHGFWDELKGPMPGFVPALIAALLFMVSIYGLITSFREKDAERQPENWTILLAAFITFGLVFLIGMIPALMVFVFIWLRFYEKAGWKNTLIILCASLFISYGVFVLWLEVPFPQGLVFDTLINL
jgi:RsiW-degrading membrane proteinase PrsW (M82 family)